MSQTIKIKRSTGTSAPSALANGELAYLQSADNKKLYIGRPGGGSGDIDVIGGKDTVDKADAALPTTGGYMTGDITGNGTVYGRAMGTDGTKLDGIEAGADVTDTANVTSAGALMLTGGTVSGDIDLNDDVKITFGGGDLEIYYDSTSGNNRSVIKEVGNGNLDIMGSNLSLKDSNGDLYFDATENGVVKLFTDNIESLRTVSAGIRVYNSSGNKGSVLADLEGNADTATTATTATNVNLVADNGSTDSHRIIFANSQTGSQTLQTGGMLYTPSTGDLSVGSGGLISCGDLTLNNGTISSVQKITGASVMTIDPAADGATGEVIIQGNLTVKGATTTIDSNTLSVGDSLIVLNGDETGTPSQNSGIEVERGNQTNVTLSWVETGTTSTSYWAVSDGSGVSPYTYPILHSQNFETAYSGNIEGGSF
tara:strand:+ start:1847 stop:3121 length:1275 start_codon:yes stop_codon:yes gene_type:complete